MALNLQTVRRRSRPETVGGIGASCFCLLVIILCYEPNNQFLVAAAVTLSC